jgi:hypothetical protein
MYKFKQRQISKYVAGPKIICDLHNALLCNNATQSTLAVQHLEKKYNAKKNSDQSVNFFTQYLPGVSDNKTSKCF